MTYLFINIYKLYTVCFRLGKRIILLTWNCFLYSKLSRSTIKIQRILQSAGKFENAQLNDPHLKLLRMEGGGGRGGGGGVT